MKRAKFIKLEFHFFQHTRPATDTQPRRPFELQIKTKESLIMAAATHSLPALRTKPKAIFFTDFDGTITLQDSNDWMTDNLGFGVELRVQGNKDVLHKGRPFRDAFQDMLDSVTKPFDQCIELLLQNVQLDPAFKEFASWVCLISIYPCLSVLTFCAPLSYESNSASPCQLSPDRNE